MQTMTIIYAPKKKYYLLKTGKFVNMESFIENIREETARVVP
jgi:preprotein translocase subunit SecE